MFLRRHKLTLRRRIRHALRPERGLKHAYKRALHYLVWRLKRLPGTPVFIARGFAIGVAINFWPILYTHLFFGYILCIVLGGSLLSMFIGTLLGNPLTFAIVYPLMYKVGKIMMGLRPVHSEKSLDSAEEVFSKIWPIESWHKLWVVFQEIILPMMIGGFLIGLPVTIFSYYLARNAIRVYQVQRRHHLLKKFEKVEHDIETPHTENT